MRSGVVGVARAFFCVAGFMRFHMCIYMCFSPPLPGWARASW